MPLSAPLIMSCDRVSRTQPAHRTLDYRLVGQIQGSDKNFKLAGRGRIGIRTKPLDKGGNSDKNFGHQIHRYQRSDQRSDNAVALWPLPYSMSFVMQAIEHRIKQKKCCVESSNCTYYDLHSFCFTFPNYHGLCHRLRHHQGSNFEAVNEYRDHVEISLRAQQIFEDLRAEKEIS
jgi:hypothetical protein